MDSQSKCITVKGHESVPLEQPLHRLKALQDEREDLSAQTHHTM